MDMGSSVKGDSRVSQIKELVRNTNMSIKEQAELLANTGIIEDINSDVAYFSDEKGAERERMSTIKDINDMDSLLGMFSSLATDGGMTNMMMLASDLEEERLTEEKEENSAMNFAQAVLEVGDIGSMLETLDIEESTDWSKSHYMMDEAVEDDEPVGVGANVHENVMAKIIENINSCFMINHSASFKILMDSVDNLKTARLTEAVRNRKVSKLFAMLYNRILELYEDCGETGVSMAKIVTRSMIKKLVDGTIYSLPKNLYALKREKGEEETYDYAKKMLAMDFRPVKEEALNLMMEF